MSSGSACWILWLTPMDWLALSIGRSGSQPLEYSLVHISSSYNYEINSSDQKIILLLREIIN